MKSKKVIKLTESDLRNVILKSVNNLLKESSEDRRNFDAEWEGSPEEDDAYSEWLSMAKKLNANGNEMEKGGQLDALTQTNPIYNDWYNNMRKKHETDYLWRKHREFDEYPDKDAEMDNMWDEHGLPMESKKHSVKLTESELKRIISKSVRRVIRESLYDNNDGFSSSITSGSYDNRQETDNGYVDYHTELKTIPLKNKINYLTMLCGSWSDFMEIYGDEYKVSKLNNNWSWVDDELDTYIYQEQATIEAIKNCN